MPLFVAALLFLHPVADHDLASHLIDWEREAEILDAIASEIEAAREAERAERANARTAREGSASDPYDPPSAPEPARSVWDDLADCESGDRSNGRPVPGTARWGYNHTEFTPWGYGMFFGGLQFTQQTWDWLRDPDMPSNAGAASRAQQIAVAERVLQRQGWGAWPNCSRMLGLR